MQLPFDPHVHTSLAGQCMRKLCRSKVQPFVLCSTLPRRTFQPLWIAANGPFPSIFHYYWFRLQPTILHPISLNLCSARISIIRQRKAVVESHVEKEKQKKKKKKIRHKHKMKIRSMNKRLGNQKIAFKKMEENSNENYKHVVAEASCSEQCVAFDLWSNINDSVWFFARPFSFAK